MIKINAYYFRVEVKIRRFFFFWFGGGRPVILLCSELCAGLSHSLFYLHLIVVLHSIA